MKDLNSNDFADETLQTDRIFPQELPQSENMQLIPYEEIESTHIGSRVTYDGSTPGAGPMYYVTERDRDIVINIDTDGIKFVAQGVFYVGAAGVTGYGIFLGASFLVTWFWTPIILLGACVLIFLYVCMGSLRNGTTGTPHRSGTPKRNINITNIVDSRGGDVNITNIIK